MFTTQRRVQKLSYKVCISSNLLFDQPRLAQNQLYNNKMSGKGLGQLQSILSQMKVHRTNNLRLALKKFGNSELFSYATRSKETLKRSRTLPVWDSFVEHDLKNVNMKLPLNGFDEMIQLTEQGKLWRYPIDNEQGLEEEKQVPFEDHVFLDHLLEGFPDNENIRSFMKTVMSGLGRNHWMSVERKHEIIRFYRDYFEAHKDAYKRAGFDI